MATVSTMDTDRVWLKPSLGLAGVRQVTRDPGLCASVILDSKPYLLSNARTDPRTTAHPLVTGDLSLQFCAAAPLITAEGQRLGAVAVMDAEPRDVTAEQL
jgi:sigma-B regulation protein RsbU (phosphoserine phosphatase)